MICLHSKHPYWHWNTGMMNVISNSMLRMGIHSDYCRMGRHTVPNSMWKHQPKDITIWYLDLHNICIIRIYWLIYGIQIQCYYLAVLGCHWGDYWDRGNRVTIYWVTLIYWIHNYWRARGNYKCWYATLVNLGRPLIRRWMLLIIAKPCLPSLSPLGWIKPR